jgi:hypothetical protein
VDEQNPFKIFDELCAKSKKICAWCETALTGREKPPEHVGLVWCAWVGLRHPTKKSKKYRLCGDCYAEVLRQKREAANEKP